MTDQEFGAAIKAAIARKGWLQSQAAGRLGFAHPTLSLWANGQRPVPRQHAALMMEVFDDPEFDAVAAEYLTDGRVVLRFDGLVGERAGARACLDREIQEIRDAVARIEDNLFTVPDTNRRAEALDACINARELRVAAAEFERRVAQAYGIGSREINEAWRPKVAGKGYTKQNHPRERVA